LATTSPSRYLDVKGNQAHVGINAPKNLVVHGEDRIQAGLLCRTAGSAG
jgi:hypothetical protein